MDKPVEYLTIRQVADRVKCSYSWIHRLLEDGRLPFIRIAGHPLFLASDFLAIEKIVRALKSRGPGRPRTKKGR